MSFSVYPTLDFFIFLCLGVRTLGRVAKQKLGHASTYPPPPTFGRVTSLTLALPSAAGGRVTSVSVPC